MSKRTMTEDALFQIQNLEEALNKNAQGILASTMKEEIKSLVKESLNEQEEVDDVDTEEDEDVVMIDDTEDVTEPMDDMDSAPMPPMDDMDDVEMDDDETIDLRGASDDEVVKVFKLMGDEDGIVVTKDDDSISIVDGEDEYLIKLNEEIENEMKETYNELDEWMNEEDESDIPSEADIDAELMTFMDNPNDSNDEDDDYEKESDEEESDEDDDYEKESDEEESDEEEVLYELHMDEEDIEAEGYDKELEEMSIDEELDMYEMMQNEEDDDAGFMNPDDEIKETAFSNELEENLYEIEFEEDDMEEAYLDEKMIDEYDMEEAYLEEGKKRKKSSVSRKGRTGNGPKFSYKKENVFFKSGPKQKEGKKDMGTGKPRYSWKEEVNMEGFTENPKEMKEASRTYGAGSKKGRGLRKGITPNRNLTFESINSEVKVLREKNEEYRSALNMFRTKLNEVAIFNSNLAYATRLFTEHSTTKQEKLNILRRFDDVETLKESKNLYRVIKNEITNGNSGESTQITESIERVVSKSPSNGSATNLIESKTYENPQFLRMKDLMTKIK